MLLCWEVSKIKAVYFHQPKCSIDEDSCNFISKIKITLESKYVGNVVKKN